MTAIPAFSLSDIRNAPDDPDQTLEEIITLLQALEFDTTDWTSSSRQRKILMIGALVMALDAARAKAVVNSGNVMTATGDALTERAFSFFDETRILGQATKGTMGLTLTPDQAPLSTIPAGEMVISDGQLRFFNENDLTISGLVSDTAGNFILTASFVAEASGSRYNINMDGDAFNNDVTVNGLTIRTDPQTTSGWITQTGVDEETDRALRQRCTTKWGRLTTIEMINTRVINVVTQVTGVTNAYVDEDNGVDPGDFTVYIAQDLQEATDAQVTASYQSLTASVMNGASRVHVQKAATYEFDRSIDIYFRPSYLQANVFTVVTGTIENLIAQSPVGGVTYNSLENIFSINEIVHDLEDLIEIKKIVITPQTDIQLFLTASQTPLKLITPAAGWEDSGLLNFIKLTQD